MSDSAEVFSYSPPVPEEDDRLGPRASRHSLTFSVSEAAELLGVNEKTVRAAVEKGQIEAIRVGRLIRVVRAPLLKLLGLPEDYDFPPGGRRFP